MKMQPLQKISASLLAFLFCAMFELQAQTQRPGGGGFGGFGGGNSRSTSSSSSSSSSQYNNNGTVGSATFAIDPDTHNIIVIADEQTSEQVSNVLANLDTPKSQVLIKVVFLEVQHNNQLDFGVQGDYTGLSKNFSQLTGYVTNFSVVSNNVVPTGITPTHQSLNVGNNFGLPLALSGAAGSGGLYQMLGNDFTATIQAIAAAGKSQVLSRPSVLARDGQLAQIVVGQEIYLPSGVAYAAVGNSSTTIPTINGSYQNVGIILNVTPFIGANGLVEMILQPQTSEVDNSTPGQIITYGSSLLGSSPVYAPNINIRSANTVVVTPDSQTVVIGGLISNSKSVNDTKIPLLGDIPLLGNLFKSTARSDSKTELLIFLTPHIIRAPTQLAALTSKETAQTQLITNSISEQELDRFLERVPVKKEKPVKK